jgi:AraC-like DNA-binding protein
MGLNLTVQEVETICDEFEQHCPPFPSIDRLETIYTIPSRLGSGYQRDMELSRGLSLHIFNCTYRDLTIRIPENKHLVQFVVNLSGIVDSGEFLYQDASQSYGGSGIQRSVSSFLPATQLQVGVNIHLQPHLLQKFFATPSGELPTELQPLVQNNDWQRVFSPKTTAAMRSVVQQIIDCPFSGTTKRIYLQGKVFELIALQLEGIENFTGKRLHQLALKPITIARIYQAADILRSRLEHPPSQIELAQQVGVSHCTLNKGFRSLFGVTPFVYLTQQRMKQAETVLRESCSTVAEVANQVGYANPAQFAAAFKRQFGIAPSDCIRGKKIT